MTFAASSHVLPEERGLGEALPMVCSGRARRA